MGPSMGGFKGNVPNNEIENSDLRVNSLGNEEREAVISYNEEMPALKRALEPNYSKFYSLATKSSEEIIKKIPKLADYLEAEKNNPYSRFRSYKGVAEIYMIVMEALYEEMERMKNPLYASPEGTLSDDEIVKYYYMYTVNNGRPLYYDMSNIVHSPDHLDFKVDQHVKVESPDKYQDLRHKYFLFDAKQVVERAAMLAAWCDSIDDTMRSRIETQFIEKIRSFVMHREYYQDPVTPADLFETK